MIDLLFGIGKVAGIILGSIWIVIIIVTLVKKKHKDEMDEVSE